MIDQASVDLPELGLGIGYPKLGQLAQACRVLLFDAPALLVVVSPAALALSAKALGRLTWSHSAISRLILLARLILSATMGTACDGWSWACAIVLASVP